MYIISNYVREGKECGKIKCTNESLVLYGIRIVNKKVAIIVEIWQIGHHEHNGVLHNGVLHNGDTLCFT